MIVFPSREKFIKEYFFEFSFEERKPNFEKFKTLNSTEQYFLAEIYNWDDGIQVLEWIINSEKCDKGTALMIFWKSSPDYYFENEKNEIPVYEMETFNLLNKIVNKFQNKSFNNSKLKYNPKDDFEFEDYDFTDWEIPNEMLESTHGLKPIYLGTLIKILKNRFNKSQKRRKKRK